ncbi:MAG: hypothetical protein L6R41_007688 [Letrouitia leprolyta]|nr:MAG: hypothetical protein L6R41_007688 [Letrouitia leprolyta]
MEQPPINTWKLKSTGSTMPILTYAKQQDFLLRFPPTPPDFLDTADKENDRKALQLALHVIETERNALTNLHELYSLDTSAQNSLRQAVNCIAKASLRDGRVVVSGVGKSGKIGQKLVATLNSFNMRSSFLHPVEAMHGDLGMIGPLEAFGTPAPTSSTTTALALTDALALALAQRLHASPMAVFHKYHPGGAIGASIIQTKPPSMSDIAVQVRHVPLIVPRLMEVEATVLDALLTAAGSASGWVRISPDRIITPRKIQEMGRQSNLSQVVSSLGNGTVVEKGDWISIDAANTVQEARDWILQMRQSERGRTFLKGGTVLGIVDAQQLVSGVVEIEDIISDGELGM